jgi:hypothetical protein
MSVLEPEQIKAMRSAFKKVSEALKLDYCPDDPMSDLIVSRITERVNDGEVDPDRICSQVRWRLWREAIHRFECHFSGAHDLYAPAPSAAASASRLNRRPVAARMSVVPRVAACRSSSIRSCNQPVARLVA